jgi:hypothetical protein
MPTFTPDKIALLAKLAHGKVAARLALRGPTLEDATLGWMPSVAGLAVRPTGAPPNGYSDKAAAIQAGREYRDACRDAIAAQSK